MESKQQQPMSQWTGRGKGVTERERGGRQPAQDRAGLVASLAITIRQTASCLHKLSSNYNSNSSNNNCDSSSMFTTECMCVCGCLCVCGRVCFSFMHKNYCRCLGGHVDDMQTDKLSCSNARALSLSLCVTISPSSSISLLPSLSLFPFLLLLSFARILHFILGRKWRASNELSSKLQYGLVELITALYN